MDRILPDDDANRIAWVRLAAIRDLMDLFGHTEQESGLLFDEYHARRSGTSTWSDADYYDHETGHGIALEIEFERLTGAPRRLAHTQFLDWRTKHYAGRRGI